MHESNNGFEDNSIPAYTPEDLKTDNSPESNEGAGNASEIIASQFTEVLESMEVEPKTCENGPDCPCGVRNSVQAYMKVAKTVLDEVRMNQSSSI